MSTNTYLPSVMSLSGLAAQLSTALTNLLSGKSEKFTDVNNMSFGQALLVLIIFLLLLILIMWIGTCIFNKSVVKVFPSVNKISLVNFIGLYIVIHILVC